MASQSKFRDVPDDLEWVIDRTLQRINTTQTYDRDDAQELARLIDDDVDLLYPHLPIKLDFLRDKKMKYLVYAESTSSRYGLDELIDDFKKVFPDHKFIEKVKELIPDVPIIVVDEQPTQQAPQEPQTVEEAKWNGRNTGNAFVVTSKAYSKETVDKLGTIIRERIKANNIPHISIISGKNGDSYELKVMGPNEIDIRDKIFTGITIGQAVSTASVRKA